MPESDEKERKSSLSLFVFATVAIAITLSALKLLAMMVISPLVATAMIAYAVAISLGMHAARHDLSVWSLPGIWVSLGLCGILMYLQLLAGFIVSFLGGGFAVAILAAICVTVVGGVGAAIVSLRKSFFSVMSPVSIWWVHLNIAFLLGVPIAVLNLGIAQHLVDWISVDTALQPLEQILARQPLGWVIIVVCLLPAIGEEILFRGLIGRGLVVRYGWMVGVLVTSLLFAMIHLNVLQSISAFLIGIVLHTVYLWTGSIWAPMALHFTNNVIAVAYVRLMQPSLRDIAQHSDDQWSVSWLLAFVALEAVVGLMLAIATSRRQFKLPLACTEPLLDDVLTVGDVPTDAPASTAKNGFAIEGNVRISRSMRTYWLFGLVGLITMFAMLFQSYFEQPFQ